VSESGVKLKTEHMCSCLRMLVRGSSEQVQKGRNKCVRWNDWKCSNSESHVPKNV